MLLKFVSTIITHFGRHFIKWKISSPINLLKTKSLTKGQELRNYNISVSYVILCLLSYKIIIFLINLMLESQILVNLGRYEQPMPEKSDQRKIL